VLDLRADRLRYCSGGQFPYPVLSDGHEINCLSSHDKPVGLFEDSLYTEHQVEMPPQCQLLMISDGILELFPRDSAKRRTEWLLQEIAQHGLDIDRLVERFDIEQLKELPDDVAFLSVSHGDAHE
jgi:serine phosphatase RsbU (regulator of sigma subunit)